MPTQVMLGDREVLRQSKVHTQQSRAEGEWRCSGFKMHEMQQGVRRGEAEGVDMHSCILKTFSGSCPHFNRENISDEWPIFTFLVTRY